MSDAGSLNERLIRPLLERVDRAAEQTLPAAHPEEETLVLFAQGTLDGPARAATVEHLAECVDCRKAVSLLLTLLSVGAGGDPLTPRAATRRVSRRTVIASLSVATAAGLLLALTLFHGPRGPGLAQQEKIRQQAVALLAANQYDQVSRLIAQAENQGAGSAGLKSLQSQAVRHMPDPLALACAGRLSDFGYGIDGVIARAPALAPGRGEARQAEQLLAAAGDSNVDVLLNRGHALLALDQPQPALAEFQKAVAAAPDQPLAWLGRGLARFMLEDYPAAADDFRRCLQLDSRLVAAQINLGMTLDEQGQSDQSLPLWKSLLQEPLAPGEREKIQEQVNQLERQRAK
ncbi:MAG: tetratricopeptide repeat protein [Thermoguttaceae bacterium]